MAPQDSPVLCVTCRQAVPESVPDISYFAGTCLKPAADDVGAFLDDLRDLSKYLEAVLRLLCEDPTCDDDLLSDSLNLGWALASEARRRVQLAHDAWERVDPQAL